MPRAIEAKRWNSRMGMMRTADDARTLLQIFYCSILVCVSASFCQRAVFARSARSAVPRAAQGGTSPRPLPSVPATKEESPPPPSPSPSDAPEMPSNGSVTMHLQGEVPLDALVGYVAKRLGVRFAFETNLASQKVPFVRRNKYPLPRCGSCWETY